MPFLLLTQERQNGEGIFKLNHTELTRQKWLQETNFVEASRLQVAQDFVVATGGSRNIALH